MADSSTNVKQDLSLESFITMVRQDPDLKAEIKAALNQDDVSGDFIVLEASVALADSLKLNSAHRKNRRNESIELIKAAPRATCSQSLENVA